jgi:hypothetical protein
MFSFFKSSSNNKDGKDEPLLGETSSESGSSYDHMRTDMQTPGTPTWMSDSDAPACFSCDAEFSFMGNRRHHCRRCRSIFCENCTLKRSKILILAITEEARVCDDCFAELPFENNYIEIKKPILLRGDTFKKSGGCCSGSVSITVLLDTDGRTLVISEDKGKVIRQNAADLDNIASSSDTSFLLVADGLSINFECESESTKIIWIEALKSLVKVSRELSLHDQVARIRRLKVENARRAADQEKRNEAFVKDMNERKNKREAIRARSLEKK